LDLRTDRWPVGANNVIQGYLIAGVQMPKHVQPMPTTGNHAAGQTLHLSEGVSKLLPLFIVVCVRIWPHTFDDAFEQSVDHFHEPHKVVADQLPPRLYQCGSVVLNLST